MVCDTNNSISKGQINRRKNENLSAPTDLRSYPYPSRHTPPYDYTRRGRGRGGNSGRGAQFRNSSLINTHQDSVNEGVTLRAGSTLQWKNPAVFEHDAKARNEKRITPDPKAHRNQKQHVMQVATRRVTPATIATSHQHYINISGQDFRVEKGGSKLVNELSEQQSASPRDPLQLLIFPDNRALALKTPKQAEVNGVLFRRTRNGNLIRASAVGRWVPRLGPLPFSSVETDKGRASRSKKKRTKLCSRFTSTGKFQHPT